MDSTVSYYECHRSGASILKDNSKRMKHSKRSGSVKIEKTCPATMKVTKQVIQEATEIVVEYQTTHLGHEHEVGKLRLTHQERTGLAEMLKSGIPSSCVLDKVQQEYSPTKRLGLTTRQDINNIRRDFHIEKTIAHKEDAISADILVQKKIAEDHNSILVYKPIGDLVIAVDEHKEQQSVEKSAIINQVRKRPKTDISAQKASLALRLENISNQIQTLKTSEDLDGAAELTKNLEMYLQTISSKHSLPTISDEIKNTPINKVINQQRKSVIKKKHKQHK